MSSLLKLSNPIPQETVKVSDGEGFAVRGLSPAHVVDIYFRHIGELGDLIDRLVAQYQEGGGQFTVDTTAVIAMNMAKDAPLILGEIIAAAAGADPADEQNWADSVQIAFSLPFPVQADALEKIAALTFSSDMPPGKFVRLVARAVQSVTPSRPSI